MIDRLAVGCAVEGWTISDWLRSWPRQQQDQRRVRAAAARSRSLPRITMPAATVEKLLPSASLTLTINGVDYVTSKNIVSLETRWKNNIRMDAGFFPGSGFQTAGDATTGAIRGRLEFGNRAGALKFVARFDHNSTELTLSSRRRPPARR